MSTISKQRLYRKYGHFPKAYRIIHLETSSDIVMRPGKPNGKKDTTAEDTLLIVDRLHSFFKEPEGILTPEHGGTGGDDGIAPEAAKLHETHSFITDLESEKKADFNGTQDVSMGVTGVLPPEHGGTGVDNLAGLIYQMIEKSKVIDRDGLTTGDKVAISDVSDGTGKQVTIMELAQYISTLITTPPYIRSATAPTNTTIIWIDSANSDIAKYYNGSTWVAIKTAWA